VVGGGEGGRRACGGLGAGGEGVGFALRGWRCAAGAVGGG